jgi:hypothetical protein
MTRFFIFTGFLMGILIAGLGITLLITAPDTNAHNTFPSYYLGYIMIPYGLFRIYRAWRVWQQLNKKEKQIA